MFSNVETASGFDKLFLITTKQHLDIARKWVDDLINAMINEKFTAADVFDPRMTSDVMNMSLDFLLR